MDLDKGDWAGDRLDFDSLRRAAVTALKHVGFAEHEVAEVVGHEHPRVTLASIRIDRSLRDCRPLLRPSNTLLIFKRNFLIYLPISGQYGNSYFVAQSRIRGIDER